MALITPILILIGIAGFAFAASWMQRRGWIDVRRDRARRGGGRAALGLQEFIQPSVENLIRVEDSVQKQTDDREGDDPKLGPWTAPLMRPDGGP